MTDNQAPSDLRRRLSFCAVVPIDTGKRSKQSASSILLVTPKYFTRNAETAEDNKFMGKELTEKEHEVS